MPQRRQDAVQLLGRGIPSWEDQALAGPLQERQVAARRGREALVVVGHPDRSALTTHRDLVAIHLFAKLFAQHRQQRTPLLGAHGRIPFHVEVVGVDRARPVLQQVEPPSVLTRSDAHVVWDEIHDVGHLLLPERVAEGVEVRARSQARIQLAVIDDIVPVGAALLGLEQR